MSPKRGSAGPRRGAVRLVAAATIAALVAAGITAVVRDGGDAPVGPARSAAVEYLATGIVITVSPTTELPIAAVGGTIRYAVSAHADQPLTALELWADEAPVDVAAFDGPDFDRPEAIDAIDAIDAIERVLSWVPDSPGPHVVFARAIGSDGRVGQSNVLTVDAAPPGRPLTLEAHEARAGETLSSIAADAGSDLAALEALNPGVAPRQALEPGTPVMVPRSIPTTDTFVTDDLPADAPAAVRDLVGGGGRSRQTDRTTRTTNGPDLAVDLEGCEVVASTSTDAVVSELGPADEVFVPIPVAGNRTARGSVGPGTHRYVATDRNSLALSAPVRLDVPESCGGTWDGDVQLRDGVLRGPDTADVAYLYLRVDAGPWQRVPEADGAFVAGRRGRFDFGPYLPALDGARLEVEAWGWRGGLVEIGGARFVPPAGSTIGAVVGSARAVTLSWIEQPARSDHPEVLAAVGTLLAPKRVQYRWKSALPGVTHVRWQVTSIAPPPGPTIDVGGLLAEGTSDGTTGGTFSVDLAALVTPAKQSPSAAESLAAGDIVTADIGPAGIGTAQAASAGGRFFARVLPFAGDQFLGAASNAVRLEIVDADALKATIGALVAQNQSPAPDAYKLAIKVQPPIAPNPGYFGCFQFVRWDWNEVAKGMQDPKFKFQYATWFKFMGAAKASGNEQLPICGGCYVFGATTFAIGGADIDNCTQSDLEWVGEQFVDALTTLWDDLIVGTFNGAKAWLVDALVDATGCKAFVGLGTSDAKAAKWCKAAATFAVDVALVYLGVPPNLPTFAQAIEGAKGDLAGLAVEYAKAAGVPCDEIGAVGDALDKDEIDCEAVVKALLDELQHQVEESWHSVASQVLGELPPGFVLAPYPAGQTRPASVTVTVTRTPKAPPFGTTCGVMLTSSAKWGPKLSVPSWWKNPGAGPQRTLATLPGRNWMESWLIPWQWYEGQAFVAVFAPLPKTPLNPGVATRTYTLYQTIDRDPVSAAIVYGPEFLDWRALPYPTLQLHAGAQFRVDAFSGCASDAHATVTVTGESVVGGVVGAVSDAAGAL